MTSVKFHFWYSRTAQIHHHNNQSFFAFINGKKVLYTTFSYLKNPPDKRIDNLYLGQGELYK